MTLQIPVHADKVARSKPLLIFREKRSNNTVLRNEAKKYD